MVLGHHHPPHTTSSIFFHFNQKSRGRCPPPHAISIFPFDRSMALEIERDGTQQQQPAGRAAFASAVPAADGRSEGAASPRALLPLHLHPAPMRRPRCW
ncbi:hypothetical protein BRADI_3g05283v3 [Brachypodium distachyon]|uniref:Uncharacterized protein n=1 Tax=Brachypodium distachyon TaxID=15368 RepID=A0A2K2CVC6_BRADI|nr:hypothetical protein BRADI_3g05283v3 [Brachypodium distachyon]